MNARKHSFTATTANQRLDIFLLEHLDCASRTEAQKLIRAGHVLVNGQREKPGCKLKGGERVDVTLPPPLEVSLAPEAIPLHVIYEDPHVALINKAAGMVVHPGAGNPNGTLANALLNRYPELTNMLDDPETQNRLGIAHRLDRGTSGLMVIARDKPSLLALMRQFQERSVDKVYLALLESRPNSNAGLVDAPISRDPRRRKRMTVTRVGKPAQTKFTLLDDDFQGGRALVELRPLTGRTHQIRAHMAFLGCPVLGDAVYGPRKQRVKMKRLFLHASALAFDHPATGQRMRFESELPPSLRNLLDKLR